MSINRIDKDYTFILWNTKQQFKKKNELQLQLTTGWISKNNLEQKKPDPKTCVIHMYDFMCITLKGGAVFNYKF